MKQQDNYNCNYKIASIFWAFFVIDDIFLNIVNHEVFKVRPIVM